MDGAMCAGMVRLWTAGTRIACFLTVVMPFAALARTILVPTQPVSPYLDTEVSTNFALHAGRTDTWGFDLRIQIAGTPTNDLEVAFGVDANTNGVLEVEEIETVYGWRGGRYFVENVSGWDRIETEAATNALCSVLEVSLQNSSSAVPRRFAQRAAERRRSLPWRPHRLLLGSSGASGTWCASCGAARGSRRSGFAATSSTSRSP